MKSVSMHEAKTHLSRLVKEEFIITNNGRPVARVVPLGDRTGKRVGFLPPSVARQTRVPEDFDQMGSEEIAAAFGSAE